MEMEGEMGMEIGVEMWMLTVRATATGTGLGKRMQMGVKGRTRYWVEVGTWMGTGMGMGTGIKMRMSGGPAEETQRSMPMRRAAMKWMETPTTMEMQTNWLVETMVKEVESERHCHQLTMLSPILQLGLGWMPCTPTASLLPSNPTHPMPAAAILPLRKATHIHWRPLQAHTCQPPVYPKIPH
jgi:hypothetical protein